MLGFVLAVAAMSGLAPQGVPPNRITLPQIEVLPFDRVRSHAEFQVRVVWLFTIEGRFGVVDGEMRIDHAARVASVVAEIDAATVAMNSESNAAWARSSEFFDTAHHPKIRFESDPFPLAVLETGGAILGQLNVRGKTRSTSFMLRPSGCVEAIAHACAVIADGSIQRSDFGMHSRRTTLSDKVKLHFTIFAAPH